MYVNFPRKKKKCRFHSSNLALGLLLSSVDQFFSYRRSHLLSTWISQSEHRIAKLHQSRSQSSSPSSLRSSHEKDANILESTTSSEDGSFYELLQPVVSKNKKKKIVHKMKNLERLNIPTISEEKIPQPTVLRLAKIRSHCSLYELEDYELKGFNDLGFVFSKEKFSDRHNELEERKVGKERRSSLSETWFIDRADSPLLNLRRLPKTIEGTDMKGYLKFWAQRVASSACHELYS